MKKRVKKLLGLVLLAFWVIAFITTFCISMVNAGFVFLISATILSLALLGMRKDLREEIKYQMLMLILMMFFLWFACVFKVLEKGFENPKFWPVFWIMFFGILTFWVVKDVRKYGWKGSLARDIKRFKELIRQ